MLTPQPNCFTALSSILPSSYADHPPKSRQIRYYQTFPQPPVIDTDNDMRKCIKLNSVNFASSLSINMRQYPGRGDQRNPCNNKGLGPLFVLLAGGGGGDLGLGPLPGGNIYPLSPQPAQSSQLSVRSNTLILLQKPKISC